MSQVPNPPPRLTRNLTEKISAEAARITAGGAPIASPLDWIASHAGVKKLTIRRWAKTAAAVRRSEATGPRANRWTGFVDALDALMSACANAHAGSLLDFAENEGSPRQALDARLALLKRVDAHEAQLDAADTEIEVEDSIAHLPQDVIDAGTPAQNARLDELQALLISVVSEIETLVNEMSSQVPEPD